MKKSVLGLAILGVVAAVAVGVSLLDFEALKRDTLRQAPIDLAIYYGGEKSDLLQNPEVQRIIEDRHRVHLTAIKAGSIEMATELNTDGKDCLWPSNALAVDLARSSGKSVLGAETIFNSPIVLYAWAEVADALIAKGVVRQGNDGFLRSDVTELAKLVRTEARWKEDLGLNVYGRFKVFSTDPTKSNSGNIWAGLLATALNDGEVPTTSDLPMLLPQIDAYFAQMGYMEASSGDIFDNFLKQGMGARPIIVGYENQLVEFLQANQAQGDMIHARIRVIYPEPTVFSSHPLISLTPSCARLVDALSDPELMAIAWSEHGFRTGLIGVENDPADLTFARLPETVTNVVPMPPVAVMSAIIDALQ